jgi:hypothetical protein
MGRSYRAFAFGEQGVVKLNWQPERKKENQNPQRESDVAGSLSAHPPNIAESGAPSFSAHQRNPK